MKKTATICLVSLIVFLMTSSPIFSCYAIIAGKKATVDGSVLFAHSELNFGKRFLNFRIIPRIKNKPGTLVKLRHGGTYPDVAESYSFIWGEKCRYIKSDLLLFLLMFESIDNFHE